MNICIYHMYIYVLHIYMISAKNRSFVSNCCILYVRYNERRKNTEGGRKSEGGRILKAGGSVHALIGLYLEAVTHGRMGDKVKGGKEGRILSQAGRRGQEGLEEAASCIQEDRHIFAYARVTSYNGHITYLDTSACKCILKGEKGLYGAFRGVQRQWQTIGQISRIL